MTLTTATYLTRDEEYNPASRISDEVKSVLKKHLTDTYNKQYVVTVEVRELSEPEKDDEEEDG